MGRGMTMREKMARAMCEKAREQGSRGVKWEDISGGHRREWLGIADAALDALLKPTEGVIDAGVDINQFFASMKDFPPRTILGICVRVMIQAAKDGK